MELKIVTSISKVAAMRRISPWYLLCKLYFEEILQFLQFNNLAINLQDELKPIIYNYISMLQQENRVLRAKEIKDD